MNELELLTEGDINFSAPRQEWYKVISDPETDRYLQRDAALFLHQALSTPCLDVLESCDGIYLTDVNGKRYMDFHGNNVHQVGYNNSFVLERVKKQMEQLAFSPRRYTNPVAIAFAEKLCGYLPADLNRVLFAPGGTSAVSMALKLARIVTGRQKVVSLQDSFHGASMDAIAAGGEAQFKKGLGPMLQQAINIPQPAGYRSVTGGEQDVYYAEYLEEVIIKEGDVGAFIAETIRNTDVQIPSKAYWKKIREICTRHKVLLILDEIPIAFGRTGTMFAFEHYAIEPDILCLGKGLGAGIIPFAAMVAREEYNIATDVSLGHFTHEKSPLGSAAAIAMLEFIENNGLIQKVKQDENFLRSEFEIMKGKYQIIGDIRGIGLLWGIELVLDHSTKQKASAKAELIMYECLKNGLSFKVSQSNVLQLSPPLTISRGELLKAIEILEAAIEKYNE